MDDPHGIKKAKRGDEIQSLPKRSGVRDCQRHSKKYFFSTTSAFPWPILGGKIDMSKKDRQGNMSSQFM